MAQTDKYINFKELSEKEREGSDYQRLIEDRNSDVAIIAPHGGGIEQGTSEIAKAIAGEEFSLYCFKGCKSTGNRDLHITGTNFDEASCVELVSRSLVVMAIHGCDDRSRNVYVGGLDEVLKAEMFKAFLNNAYEAKDDTTAHAGRDTRNICNRSSSGKGLQLEISKELRLTMFETLGRVGREKTTPEFDKFVAVVRGVLMENPKIQLRTYLKTLFQRFLNTKSLYQELLRIYGWKTPGRFEAYSLGANSFELAEYSLLRTVLVEISALLSKHEQRSLIHWLKKAREHAASLEPTCYNPGYPGGGRQPIKEEEYRALIGKHNNRLAAQQTVIDQIKARRDKAIAHLDGKYLDNPKALDEDYPLTYANINCLMDLVSEILRKHYSCLFSTDPGTEIHILRSMDKVLKYARAFQRARNDSALIKKGFKPVAYMQDE